MITLEDVLQPTKTVKKDVFPYLPVNDMFDVFEFGKQPTIKSNNEEAIRLSKLDQPHGLNT